MGLFFRNGGSMKYKVIFRNPIIRLAFFLKIRRLNNQIIKEYCSKLDENLKRKLSLQVY